jgi:hypothetical protein
MELSEESDFDESENLPSDFEIEEVLGDIVTVFGTQGELLAIGFQDRDKFLQVFGSPYG